MTLPFFILEDVSFQDFPAISNLYGVIQQIPEFHEIDEGFTPNPASQSMFGYFREVWTSVKLVTYMKWNGVAMNV